MNNNSITFIPFNKKNDDVVAVKKNSENKKVTKPKKSNKNFIVILSFVIILIGFSISSYYNVKYIQKYGNITMEKVVKIINKMF